MPDIDYDWFQGHNVERRYGGIQLDEDGRSPYDRDYARVINSTAFRKLQGKTQIFAPAWADFMRTRVTHSIEVEQIGRVLAKRIGVPESLVAAVCLGHDLGHPPFGHTGEEALEGFMRQSGGYEGNAQTFRIVTRLEQKAEDYSGLDLCRATLLGLIKYPFRKKPYEPTFGAFPKKEKFLYDDDADAYESWLYSGSDYHLTVPDDAEPCPTTIVCQLMDWADDIAYSVHDLEDGMLAGLIDPSRFVQSDFVDTIFKYVLGKSGDKGNPPTEDEVANILKALAQALHAEKGKPSPAITRQVSGAYINKFVTGVKGTTLNGGKTPFDFTLDKPRELEVENLVLKGITFEYVIKAPSTMTFAYKGRMIVGGLVMTYYNSMEYNSGLFPIERRQEVDELMAKMFYPEAQNHDMTVLDDQRRRLVSDFIAGMTEGQAINRYTTLHEARAGSLFDPL